MSQLAKLKAPKLLSWVLVATGCTLLTWLVLAYYLPQVGPSGWAVTTFREDTDFLVYFSNLGWIDQGRVLFTHGYAEYPPLGLLYVNWPQLFASSFTFYSWWLRFSNAFLYLGVAWLTWQTGRLLGQVPARTWWWWLLPSTMYFSLNRFDVLPVFLLALGLYLLLSGRYRSGWFAYGLSIMAKLYPVFLLPLMLAIAREHKQPLRHHLPYLLAPILSFSLSVGVVGGWLAVFYPYLLQFGRYVESGGVLALVVGVWPEGLPALLALAKLGQFAVLAWWLWLTTAVQAKLTLQTQLTLAALTLLCIIFFSPFYSNQWWVWVVPFLVLTLPPSAWWLVLAHDALNYLQLPLAFELYGWSSPPFNLVVGVRSAVLLVLMVMVWRQLPRRWWVAIQ